MCSDAMLYCSLPSVSNNRREKQLTELACLGHRHGNLNTWFPFTHFCFHTDYRAILDKGQYNIHMMMTYMCTLTNNNNGMEDIKWERERDGEKEEGKGQYL